MNAPLILILAASIGSVPVHPGLPGHRGLDLGDSENGATTSRSACFRPRSGATGTCLADREVVLAAEARATGTAMGVPLPSALPPSMGTTGPMVLAGAGLARGIARAGALDRGRLAAHRGQHRAGGRPGHHQHADQHGNQAPGLRGRTGTWPVAKDDVRRPRTNASVPTYPPKPPYREGANPARAPAGRRVLAAGRAHDRPGRSGVGRAPGVRRGVARASLSSPGVVTGAWQVNWRQT